MVLTHLTPHQRIYAKSSGCSSSTPRKTLPTILLADTTRLEIQWLTTHWTKSARQSTIVLDFRLVNAIFTHDIALWTYVRLVLAWQTILLFVWEDLQNLCATRTLILNWRSTGKECVVNNSFEILNRMQIVRKHWAPRMQCCIWKQRRFYITQTTRVCCGNE